MTAKLYIPITPLLKNEVNEKLSLGKRHAKLWDNERENCFKGEVKRKFYERWGIELGLVEDIFRWDRGVTMTLLEKGLSPEILANGVGSTQHVATVNIATISSHVKTLQEFEMGFVTGEAELTANFIRQLQEQLLLNQDTHDVFVQGHGFSKRDLVKGAFKDTSNDPFNPEPPHEKIKSYCPSEDTESEIIKLCDLFKTSVVIKRASPIIQAAWLHHRFTQIHPFSDGNGRVARTLASLVLVKARLPPLIIRRDEDRSIYLDALEAADEGNLQLLAKLFVDRLRDEILHLITDSGTVSDALDSARRALLDRIDLRKERAEQLFNHIHAGAQNRFNGLGSNIQNILVHARRNTERFTIDKVTIAKPGSEAAHDYDGVIESAHLGYTPRVTEISGYASFSITTDFRFVILVHIHERDALNGGGFVVAALMLEYETDGIEDVSISKIPIDPLLISVEDSAINATQNEVMKFSAKAIELGVSIWGKSL